MTALPTDTPNGAVVMYAVALAAERIPLRPAPIPVCPTFCTL